MGEASSTDVASELAEVAGELYGLAVSDFVAHRSAAVAAAKAAGNRELAGAIGSLKKPTAAAWMLNSLVRSRPEAIEGLVAFGERMRDGLANGDGDDIRQLMRERSRVVAEALSSVRSFAAAREIALSTTVAEQIEQTLRAAITSEANAVMLTRGVLSAALREADVVPLMAGARPVRRNGAEPLNGAHPSRALQQPRGNASVSSATEARALRQRRAEAKRRVAEMEVLVADAERDLDTLMDRRADHEREREALTRRLASVDATLSTIRSQQTDIEANLKAAKADLRSARQDLDELDDGGRPNTRATDPA